jgi:two-component system LytT family response regulator
MSKIILIDDEPLARTVVKEYLQTYPDLEIVQECNDGFEGVKAIQQHQPDLIFLTSRCQKSMALKCWNCSITRRP